MMRIISRATDITSSHKQPGTAGTQEYRRAGQQNRNKRLKISTKLNELFTTFRELYELSSSASRFFNLCFGHALSLPLGLRKANTFIPFRTAGCRQRGDAAKSSSVSMAARGGP
ncbi:MULTISPECIES: hypothetical protein [unclassified Rhizobium]|jgi:hypothetical protein|uniref:hypothetical protein n=1 Tax=unclassified Rhizobium TaxID=2613769 RepID=UPI0011C46D22|nr:MULTISPECIES: hypothetical protein [unclassified Rhizobium]MBN8950123.1 hypothetical protein [Rhizobium tropici]